MGRTLATARLYASIVWAIVACILSAIRESLPDSEETAGAFLSGMAWMFAIQMVLLVGTSYLYVLSTAR